MQTDHDPDIAALNLSEIEKNGLQVYRDYTSALTKHQTKQFAETAELGTAVVEELSKVLRLVVTEELRSLPVIGCAYADDQLKEMFRREIPSDVPGGKSEILSGFGPLSRLSQRIQMAYAFNWLSKDLLLEIDHLRKVRNDVSHRWDTELLATKLEHLVMHRQQPIEEHLADGQRLPSNFHASLTLDQKLRVRLVWLLGRLTYECHHWVPALKANLSPADALYGQDQPKMLATVAAECLKVTRPFASTDRN